MTIRKDLRYQLEDQVIDKGFNYLGVTVSSDRNTQ